VLVDGQTVVAFDDVLWSVIKHLSASSGEIELLGGLNKLEHNLSFDSFVIREDNESIEVVDLKPLKSLLAFGHFSDKELKSASDVVNKT
jgi:hypothetical protein